MLKVADILAESVVDGIGLRVVVFFQGCAHLCEGCHNPALLPFVGGKDYDVEVLGEKILSCLTKVHRGVTFSGGDPLFQKEELKKLLTYLKTKKPEINIWLYTGYKYEEITDAELLEKIDVLVDGKFEQTQRDLLLRFRGSSNQRIIDVPSSLKMQEIKELIK